MHDETLKLLVLSDLHVFASSANGSATASAPSYIDVDKLSSEPYRDPFERFRVIAENTANPVAANLIVCGGDMGNGASPQGISFAWRKLHELKNALHATHVLATAGNHDLDSRYNNDPHDPLKTIKALNPPFPGLDKALCDRYWSQHFTTLESAEWRVVLLNSCAYHGGGRVKENEFQSGRVSQNTLMELREEILRAGPRLLNILLCHHHPVRNNQIQDEDYSEMQGGDALVHELGDWEVGPWVIIHGHRHFPRIIYAQGGSTSPTIFSAGSFGARLYPELGSQVRNQIYHLEFPYKDFKKLGLDVAGRGKAWDWIANKGWMISRPDSGLPHAFGFGRRVTLETDCGSIDTALRSSNAKYLSRAELFSQLPWLEYVVPTDFKKIIDRLRQQGIRTTFDSNGDIDQIGLRP